MPRAAAVLGQLTVELFDPRGRCDRRGLLALALYMMGLQVIAGTVLYAAEALEGAFAAGLNCVFVYTACAATSKRLHDTGRSAWWIVAGLTTVVLWSFALSIGGVMTVGLEALKPNGYWATVIVGLSAVPAFAMLLWLHFAPGEKAVNAYGPTPTGLGFARNGHRQSGIAAPSMAVSA